RSQEDRIEFATKGFRDAAIAQLSDADVSEMILRIASLPQKAKGNGHKKPKAKQISTTTAKNCLNTLRYFLIWADETDRWTAPKRMNKLFRQVRFRPPQDLNDGEVAHFD